MARSLRNVVQRNRIFHFRRAIPRDLRLLFGLSELTCSLRTSELRIAEFRSRQLYIASETLFIESRRHESRRHTMLSDDQLALIVQDFYAYVLDRENRLRLQLGAIPEEARLRRAEFYKEVVTRSRTDLARNEFDSVYLIAWFMMRKHNVENSLDKDEKNQLKQALLRGGIDLAEAVRARYEGDFNYEPRDKLLKQKVEALFAASPAPVPWTPVREPSPASDAPSFNAVSADFITKQKQLRRWENQTAAQNEKTYELFSAILR